MRQSTHSLGRYSRSNCSKCIRCGRWLSSGKALTSYDWLGLRSPIPRRHAMPGLRVLSHSTPHPSTVN